MNTLLRQWAMLRAIPRAPRRIDTTSIRDKLTAQGYEISLRTIQRDLNMLSKDWPLLSDEAKPQGWWWPKDAALDIPGLDPQTALVFKMAESHLAQVLPAATLDALSPWFKAANGVIDNLEGEYGRWTDKVRILPKGLALLPPKIDPLVQETVYQALLGEKRLSIVYLTRGATSPKEYEISPLGLVQKGQLFYIVCTIKDYDDLSTLLLHRFQSAKLLQEKSVRRPAGFDIDRYILEGNLGYPKGPPIQLIADFEENAAMTLFETPLTEAQTLVKQANGTVRVTATVPNTMDLIAWLNSYGKKVKVIEPATFLDRE